MSGSRQGLAMVALAVLVVGAWLSAPIWLDRGESADLAATAVPESVSPAHVAETLAPVENPGRFHTATALVCSETQANAKTILAHNGSHTLPPWAQSATVFVNGWRLRYLDKDHHVRGLFVDMGAIRRDGNQLKWRARGRLFDRNGDDRYEFCYTYTVIAWNPAVFAAHVRALDRDAFRAARGVLDEEVTAEIPSGLMVSGAVVSLPRRFGVAFANAGQWGFHRPFACWECPLDRELLQLGFNRTPHFAFDPSDSLEELRWNLQAILKGSGPVEEGDMIVGSARVGLVAGGSVTVRHQAFDLEPAEFDKPWYQTCVSADGARRIESLAIENVVAESAIPVLAGFELTYTCGEHNVKEVGARIVDFDFQRAPGAATGTLRYRLESVLQDRGGGPTHTIRHNVDVLGFRAAAAPIP